MVQSVFWDERWMAPLRIVVAAMSLRTPRRQRRRESPALHLGLEDGGRAGRSSAAPAEARLDAGDSREGPSEEPSRVAPGIRSVVGAVGARGVPRLQTPRGGLLGDAVPRRAAHGVGRRVERAPDLGVVRVGVLEDTARAAAVGGPHGAPRLEDDLDGGVERRAGDVVELGLLADEVELGRRVGPRIRKVRRAKIPHEAPVALLVVARDGAVAVLRVQLLRRGRPPVEQKGRQAELAERAVLVGRELGADVLLVLEHGDGRDGEIIGRDGRRGQRDVAVELRAREPVVGVDQVDVEPRELRLVVVVVVEPGELELAQPAHNARRDERRGLVAVGRH
mmetsp:Transcript_1516/g.5852  ORF Transcript_1516/g.5852 Transcript_1516/m.5852 type:complete len:336 (+) Transcript_1516:452-1459(+)